MSIRRIIQFRTNELNTKTYHFLQIAIWHTFFEIICIFSDQIYLKKKLNAKLSVNITIFALTDWYIYIYIYIKVCCSYRKNSCLRIHYFCSMLYFTTTIKVISFSFQNESIFCLRYGRSSSLRVSANHIAIICRHLQYFSVITSISKKKNLELPQERKFCARMMSGTQHSRTGAQHSRTAAKRKLILIQHN